MPRAIPLATRREIVRCHLDGQTLAQIATDLHLPCVRACGQNLGRMRCLG